MRWRAARSFTTLLAQDPREEMARHYGPPSAQDDYRCGGTLRVIADIIDPDVIQKILDHVAARPPPDHVTRTASHH